MKEQGTKLNKSLADTQQQLKETATARDTAVMRADDLQKSLTSAEASYNKAQEEITALKKALEESEKAAKQETQTPTEGTTEETPEVQEEPPAQPPAEEEPASENDPAEKPQGEEPGESAN